jgi:IMP dehydrogenase
MKQDAKIHEGFGFDDVLLMPCETNVKIAQVSTKTRLTKSIELGIPLISAGHDNVTESPMAIAMAHLGGLGVIHNNMPLGKQVEEVRRVKRAEGNMILNPITVSPDASVAEAVDLMTTYKISGIPVIESPSQKVIGIITYRDIRFFEDYAKPVSELMSK